MELQDIIDSVDVVEYISQYVELENRGEEMFGLSPFSNESTPSFSVTPKNSLWYDFSSHQGGSVLDFIQRYHKCTMHRAIQILKKYANISEDNEVVKTQLSATKTIKKYRQTESRKKSQSKQILPNDVMQMYENNKEKLKLWFDEGISHEVMGKYQVRYDPFSNRIVFPIRDLVGNIISVKGRTLDKDYKEKRLRKYTYYHKVGELDCLYGYYEHLADIVKQKEVIIFEGEKSVLLSETWGIKNTLALYTSHLNYSQLKILIKLGVRVVFALDHNINIKEDENIQKLKRFVKVEYVKDTTDTLKEKDAPVDCGLDFWLNLYNTRRVLN